MIRLVSPSRSLVRLIALSILTFSCQHQTAAPLVKTPAIAIKPEEVDWHLSSKKAFLLSLRELYLSKEGPHHRGEFFEGMCRLLTSPGYNLQDWTEFEIFALLGQPDYYAAASDQGEYAYQIESAGFSSHQVAAVEIVRGKVWNISIFSGKDFDLKDFRRYPDWPKYAMPTTRSVPHPKG